MSKVMNILCATDEAFVPYCGIMLSSLFRNNRSSRFHVYIICNGMTDTSKAKLKSLCEEYGNEISFITIDRKMTENFPIRDTDHVSLATYYRLFAPVILPEEVDRILYLDCDMIVNGRIDELYNCDIDNFALAGVLDEDYTSDSKYERLGIVGSKTYFNAGVLLINLAYWRQHNVTQRCLECIDRLHEKLLLHDQDTLNVVLKNEVRLVPVKFNMQTGFLHKKTKLSESIRNEVVATLDNPVIIHFTGPRKPWLRHYRHPYLNIFRENMYLSPWKDLELTKRFKEEFRYWKHTVMFFLHIKKWPFITR